MKTVEEKAKRYDAAIEELRGLLEGIHEEKCEIMEEDIINIFPELKESEDEKIRKELIDFFQDWHKTKPSRLSVNVSDILTWLEKQGSKPNWCHHKVDLSNCSEEYRKAYYDGWNNCNMQHSQCKSDGNDVVKCLINGMKFYYEDNEEATWGTEKFSMKVKDILSWLEKQDENKPIIEMITPEESLGIDSETYNEIVNACIFGENKSKFKVGDWIVFNGLVLFIKEVVQGYYRTISVGGIPNSYDWAIDNVARLWTIRDARDGDVLACNEEISLFKSYSVQGRISIYCWYNWQTNNFHSIEVDDALLTTRNKIYPATKEQRDLLFSKMKEEGYEWDAEKKELKKINEQHLISNYFNAEYERGKTDALKSVAWSEDDEKMVNNIIAAIDTLYYHGMVNWLKSLKDRYIWKPSDEQMHAFKQVYDWYNNNFAQSETLTSLYNDLKKLKG